MIDCNAEIGMAMSVIGEFECMIEENQQQMHRIAKLLYVKLTWGNKLFLKSSCIECFES